MIDAKNLILHLFLFAVYAQYYSSLLKNRAGTRPIWRTTGRS
jgi:hypothetical protein